MWETHGVVRHQEQLGNLGVIILFKFLVNTPSNDDIGI